MSKREEQLQVTRMLSGIPPVAVVALLSFTLCLCSGCEWPGSQFDQCKTDQQFSDTEFCHEDGYCVDACAGRQCGEWNGIVCGSCDALAPYCNEDGQCEDPCIARECGTWFGIECGMCPGGSDIYCSDEGACVTAQCGNGSCEPTEGTSGCLQDCRVIQVATGIEHTCALRQDGTVWCWGRGNVGQLGNGDLEDRLTPTRVPGVSKVTRIVLHRQVTCAVRNDGSVYCWGQRGSYNHIGISLEEAEDSCADGSPYWVCALPVQMSIVNDVIDLSFGYYHSCALKSDSTAWCWGSNLHFQLGDGTQEDSKDVAVQVVGLSDTESVSAGGGIPRSTSAIESHTCALAQGGQVYCWGKQSRGATGTSAESSVVYTEVPTPAIGLSSGVSIVGTSRNNYFSCALKTDGAVWCMGTDENYNIDGLVGIRVPEQIDGFTDIMYLAVGHSEIYGIGNDLSLWCMGRSPLGYHQVPTQIPMPDSIVAVSPSDGRDGQDSFVCAISQPGTIWCWGNNRYGQLGDGTTTTRDEPAAVID